MTLDKGTPDRPRRRRGAELENALLDAAWQELIEHGYDALTYERVAARAATSRAVEYRRWATKPELVRAVIAHGGRTEVIETIDTGTLRGDLIALLREANRSRARFITLLTTHLAGYFKETGTGFGDVREVFIGQRESRSEAIFQRAIARGEVDPERATPRVRSLAFDLFRGELLMTQRPLPDEAIQEIVDQIVLPLVAPRD